MQGHFIQNEMDPPSQIYIYMKWTNGNMTIHWISNEILLSNLKCQIQHSEKLKKIPNLSHEIRGTREAIILSPKYDNYRLCDIGITDGSSFSIVKIK